MEANKPADSQLIRRIENPNTDKQKHRNPNTDKQKHRKPKHRQTEAQKTETQTNKHTHKGVKGKICDMKKITKMLIAQM